MKKLVKTVIFQIGTMITEMHLIEQLMADLKWRDNSFSF